MAHQNFLIKEVKTRKDLKEFLEFPKQIYNPDSHWIRQPDMVISDYLNKRKNPFYRDGMGVAILLYRDNQPVARALVTVWKRHAKLHLEKTAYFGYFECINDKDVFEKLFSYIERYAKQNDCRIIRGPFNTTAAQEMGIVLGGYENSPSIDMVYTAPWYPLLFNDAGFKETLRMETWRNNDISNFDEKNILDDKAAAQIKEAGITIRSVSKSNKDQDLELVRELVNASFLGNWSFVPITREEWKIQIGDLIPLLDLELILIAEVQGVPIGVTFTVPDFNKLLNGMNGRLLHPRILNLLNKSFFRDAVVILFSVRKQYQGMNINKAINFNLVRVLKRKNYRSLSITWIAKENQASLAQARHLGMQKIHDLCMYEKNIL